MDPRISVIVCTYNGEKRVLRTLDALVQQNFPKETYEIVVVDNNSSDGSAEVVQGFIGKHKTLRIKYCFESQQGQSHARNKGIQEAKGEILAFTDDDGVPDENWLKELYKIYQEEENVGCVGGKVILDLPKVLPEWYQKELGRNYLAGFDLRVDFPLEVNHVYSFPYGVNISFLKKALLGVGLFDPTLGKVGGEALTGDETDRCLALHQKNWRIFYQPKAMVHHVINPERISKAYFKKMACVSGYLRVIWDYKETNGSRRAIKRFRYFFEAVYFFFIFITLELSMRPKAFNSSNHTFFARQSSSKNAIISPFAWRTPKFLADAGPLFF